jgi:hypothetical protein
MIIPRTSARRHISAAQSLRLATRPAELWEGPRYWGRSGISGFDFITHSTWFLAVSGLVTSPRVSETIR